VNDKIKIDEIKSTIKGWKRFVLTSKVASSQYIAGVQTCIDQLEAILNPPEGDDNDR
jgi:hypothetical protein